MGKLEIKTEKNGDKMALTLVGTIDEDIDFNQYPLAGASEIDLHLDGVKSINSCGIREWIKWIAGSNAQAIRWHNCTKPIVDQINMVDGFLPPSGKVMSFYVPYYNDDAGSEKNVLFRYGQEYTDNEVKAPASVKDDDGNEMDMDVIEAKYFKFIKK